MSNTAKSGEVGQKKTSKALKNKSKIDNCKGLVKKLAMKANLTKGKRSSRKLF